MMEKWLPPLIALIAFLIAVGGIMIVLWMGGRKTSA